jgi:UDP-galactopyranose mutase
VFTGGQRLYEAKRELHPRVFCFPSSVDVPHFAQARVHLPEPAGQQGIPGPRLGYSGVIDERMDLDLVAAMADLRPAWQVILLGPVVKLDEQDLPRRSNLHYLGATPYAALPAYLAHWDVALIPFAQNAATRFISPTKTPEYLAAGKPVVSTPIHDVVHPYGDLGLVRIAADPAAFVVAVEACLRQTGSDWLPRVDAYLAGKSWAQTWTAMEAHLADVLQPAAVPILTHTEREVVR